MVSLLEALRKPFTKPVKSRSLLSLADQARDAKKYVEAAFLYEQHLSDHPGNGPIHVQCGHMNKEAGRLDKAGEHYLIARTLMPEDVDLHIQLGHFYKVSGRFADAIASYRRATQLSPENLNARRELAAAIELSASGSSQQTNPHDRFQAAASLPPRAEHFAANPEVSEAGSLIGFFDSFEDGVARGWAYDRNDPHAPARLLAVIDSREAGVVTCDRYREDIRLNMSHPTGQVGFVFEVPLVYFDGKRHSIGFRFHNQAPVSAFDQNHPAEKRQFLEFDGRLRARIRGCIDGMRSGQWHGWALRNEPRATRATGGCSILVTCEGRRVVQVKANQWRGDVSSRMQGDPYCGFRVTIPHLFRKPYPQTFRFHVMPENIELDGSPMVTTVVDDQLEAKIIDVADTVERMQQELSRLHKRLGGLLPVANLTLDDYDRWSRIYYDDLRKRVHDARIADTDKTAQAETPLVSVLIPTFRPLLTDFTAAVDSVLRQTYRNWELIIVDDASAQPELTALIESFCQRDPRVRSVTREKNGNISEATNTAIVAAKGSWIAFFDHDDLLVDVALEVMISHAQQTGAQALYSDEDKIDQMEIFSEPNFKPDWNHRYVLGCNYVCHLLFVKADVLQAVGPLRTKYNGAQDHDLVLRISEHLAASQIHHVPELLYHWRKTPNSTAADLSTKKYAVLAGVAAVDDHLKRLGKFALVSAINNLTIYNVQWIYQSHPSVCIIVPFKDQIEITRKCLDRLLEKTAWPKLEIILVNNWSVTDEAAAFIAEVRSISGVRILDVEEEFNYSRLNNLAAATTNAEMLVFMNNDLLVLDDQWLRILVDETLADDQVAIVSGKFLYPNGTVQHAGVVVGPEEIGSHVHRGLSGSDYGYTGRAALAQEMTAVTAAGLLIKAKVFHAVGGFDEHDLKIAYNDVDLCLKTRKAGWKVILATNFVAEHHESYSRGYDDRPEHESRLLEERRIMLDRWSGESLFAHDPAYSRHFLRSARGGGFCELVPPARS